MTTYCRCWRVGVNAIGKHRDEETSEMVHLSGKFCLHILKKMAQNNNTFDSIAGLFERYFIENLKILEIVRNKNPIACY